MDISQLMKRKTEVAEASIAILVVISLLGNLSLAIIAAIAYGFLLFWGRPLKLSLQSQRILRHAIPGKTGTFELKDEGPCAITRHNGYYVAISMARILGSQGSSLDIEKLEAVISRIAFPFKFSIMVEEFNSKKIIEKLETRKRMKEIELSRIVNRKTGSGAIRTSSLKAEIDYIGQELVSLKTQGTPLKVEYYISTFQHSEDLFSAQNNSLLRLKQLTSLFDSAFGSSSSQLNGREIIKLINSRGLFVM